MKELSRFNAVWRVVVNGLPLAVLLCGVGCTSAPSIVSATYPNVDLQEGGAEDLFSENVPEGTSASNEKIDELDLRPDRLPVENPQVKTAPVPLKRLTPASGNFSAEEPELVEEDREDEGDTVADSRQELIPMFEAAESRMKQGQYEAALRLFQDFLRASAQHVYAEAAELKIAECYVALGDHDLAIVLYDKWLRDHPDSLRIAEVLMSRARSMESAGRSERATRAYREILRQFPSEPEAVQASRRLAELSMGAKNARP